MKSPRAEAVDLGLALSAYLAEFGANLDDRSPRNPGHRVRFHWPPPQISYQYHLHESDWTGRELVEVSGLKFEIEVARTPFGVFGRTLALWLDAKGEDLDSMKANLISAAQPYVNRLHEVNRSIGRQGPFSGSWKELSHFDLLRLLYSNDRDIAAEAQLNLEKLGYTPGLSEAFSTVLTDEIHPNRRTAQWCVLDMCEDLGAYVREQSEEEIVLNAIRNLVFNAPDDFARVIFKAGVVLGGHLPHTKGGPILMECLNAPSKIGRRSAVHGLFHVVEWAPDQREEVLKALSSRLATEDDIQLAEFIQAMIRDIEEGETDHVIEPVFPEELDTISLLKKSI